MNATLKKITLYVLLATMLVSMLTIVVISFRHWDEALSMKRKLELFWKPSLSIVGAYVFFVVIKKW